MSALTIVVIVLNVLLLYIRFRIYNKSVLDNVLNFGLALLLVQVIHMYFVNTYLPYNLQLISLAPYSLLHPPLIYFIVQLSHKEYCSRLKDSFSYHLIPFAFFTVIYIVLLFSDVLLEAYGNFIFQMLLIAEIFSSLSYAIWCTVILYRSNKESWESYMRLLSEGFVLFMVLFGCFIMIQFYEQIKGDEVTITKNWHFSLVLIFISILSIFIVTIEKLIRSTSSAINDKTTKPKNEPSETDEIESKILHDLNELQLDIESEDLLNKLTELVETGWFLNPEINLQRL